MEGVEGERLCGLWAVGCGLWAVGSGAGEESAIGVKRDSWKARCPDSEEGATMLRHYGKRNALKKEQPWQIIYLPVSYMHHAWMRLESVMLSLLARAML